MLSSSTRCADYYEAFAVTLENRTMGSTRDHEDYVTLYREAFRRFEGHALWNIQFFEHPTPGDALVVARLLRVEGNMDARRLAEQIERACHAAV